MCEALLSKDEDACVCVQRYLEKEDGVELEHTACPKRWATEVSVTAWEAGEVQGHCLPA